MRARDRVVIVGRHLGKAQVFVQRPSRFHVVERVEQDAGIARGARRIEDRFRQAAPEPQAVFGWSDMTKCNSPPAVISSWVT